MKTSYRLRVRALASAAFVWAVGLAALDAAVVTPDLQQRLGTSLPSDPVAVILTFPERVDLSRYQGMDRANRPARADLVSSLKATASRSQTAALAWLASRGARRVTSLWITNSLACTVPVSLVPELAVRSDIREIHLDEVFTLPKVSGSSTTSSEWNLQMVHAPEMWATGATGSGVVVASMDSGVDSAHADLNQRWRGGANSWFDPSGQHRSPYDASGHGTQVTGLLVGGSAGGTAIGLAPDAKWIAVKIFNDSGYASLSGIHSGFQWLLDPDGDSSTNDPPDVVNSSWGFPSRLNRCYDEFAQDISVLRAAGIAVVFAAGNNGPQAPSSESPADNAGALAVGAVTSGSTIADFSGRGPAACDGSVFPEAVAPGVGVRTADLTFGGVIPLSYTTVSGTSFAAPHVAGAVALLWSAHPAASLSAIEQAIEMSAVDLGATGADDTYGFGLLDIVAADALLGSGGGAGGHDDSYATVEDTTLSVAAPGVLSNDAGANLVAILVTGASHGSVVLAGDGSFTYTPTADFAGSDAFTYKVSDGANTSPSATVRISVAAVNDPPVAASDSYAATSGTTLVVAVPGVLANDSDIEADALSSILVTAPVHASAFTLSAAGSFSYTATSGYAGADSFSYKANDGKADSNVVSVTITVSLPSNAAPVAVADAYSAVSGKALAVATPGVLNNDTDANGDVLTALLVSGPAHASAFALASNGSFSYTAVAGYAGGDAFSYKANDGTADSNVVGVTITVSQPVNSPPVAVSDAASTRRGTAVTIKVLGNDYDPDGTLVAGSVTVTTKPLRGKVAVNSDGSVKYTPNSSFRGVDSFKYTVKDNAGAVSNVATVAVTVQ
jgi:serine protease AprX